MKDVFRKIKARKANIDVPPMPSWNDIVEMLYQKGLENFCDEVVKVFYSRDKAQRYVILKNSKGFFTYILEKIYQYDEDDWKYSFNYNSCPGYWITVENKNKSIFSSLDDALNELEKEPEYRGFFL